MKSLEILKKVWNVILYVFGGFVIFGSLLSINKSVPFAIFGVLFGLSLFQVLYKIVGSKLNVDQKYLKVTRIVLPILLCVVWTSVAPPESTSDKKKTNDLKQKTIIENKKTNENEKKSTKKSESTQKKSKEKSTKTKHVSNQKEKSKKNKSEKESAFNCNDTGNYENEYNGVLNNLYPYGYKVHRITDYTLYREEETACLYKTSIRITNSYGANAEYTMYIGTTLDKKKKTETLKSIMIDNVYVYGEE